MFVSATMLAALVRVDGATIATLLGLPAPYGSGARYILMYLFLLVNPR